jgi:TRAP-type C4-dicarboxylate transport system substrate-binding protein
MKGNAKVLVAVLIVAMIFVLGACGSDSGEDANAESNTPTQEESTSEPITLIVSHGNAETSMMGQMYARWGEMVSEASDGNIIMDIHAGGTLVTQDQLFDSVSTGRLDIGDFVLSYYVPYISDLGILSIPGLYKASTPEEITKVAHALDSVIDECLAEHGLKLICVSGTMPENMILGPIPINDPPAQLNGKTIRVSGEVYSLAIEKWGGTPVNIPIGDLPTALERKTVDMAVTAWTMIQGMKLYESVPVVTATGIAESFSGMVINLDKWNSLTPEQQQILTDVKWSYHDYTVEQGAQYKEAYIQEVKDSDTEYYMAPVENFDFYHEKAMEVATEKFANPSPMVKKFLDVVETLQ